MSLDRKIESRLKKKYQVIKFNRLGSVQILTN